MHQCPGILFRQCPGFSFAIQCRPQARPSPLSRLSGILIITHSSFVRVCPGFYLSAVKRTFVRKTTHILVQEYIPVIPWNYTILMSGNPISPMSGILIHYPKQVTDWPRNLVAICPGFYYSAVKCAFVRKITHIHVQEFYRGNTLELNNINVRESYFANVGIFIWHLLQVAD